MDIKDFKCKLHHNVLDQKFWQANPGLLPEVYLEALPMATLAGRIAGQGLATLPFDCMLEAEALGVKIVGYEDQYGLRASQPLVYRVGDLASLPRFDGTGGRPFAILQAIKILKDQGRPCCLNVSGFFSIGGLVLGTDKLFVGWRQERQALLRFFEELSQDLLAYVDQAFKAGVSVVSYSDSLASRSLVGPKMAEEISQLLLMPFFEAIRKLAARGILHLCGLNSVDFAALPQVDAKVVELPRLMGYSQAMGNLAASASQIDFYGFGCLNQPKQVAKVCKFEF